MDLYCSPPFVHVSHENFSDLRDECNDTTNKWQDILSNGKSSCEKWEALIPFIGFIVFAVILVCGAVLLEWLTKKGKCCFSPEFRDASINVNSISAKLGNGSVSPPPSYEEATGLPNYHEAVVMEAATSTLSEIVADPAKLTEVVVQCKKLTARAEKNPAGL
jgi:hypothetical protein